MLELMNRHRSFGGSVEFYSHLSQSCQLPMRFSVFVPPQASTHKVPVLYWLSGLTCTEENFMAKSGVQAYAASHGLLIVSPDTSPRGAGVEGEDKDWDLGTGAGFYVDAIEAKWSKHYRMYSYVASELPKLIEQNFPILPARQSIFGHSMGGHGALVIALRNPERYRSVSAFAPISAPMSCPWGQKAFSAYLGHDQKTWEAYDASRLLVAKRFPHPILVDQGTEDKFLREQLLPMKLQEAATASGASLTLRMQEGYDHSYYFISTFIGDHLAFHAHRLKE